MTAPLAVGVVLPVHNRRDLTLRALRCLDRIDRTGMTLRVVVVDDGSTDGTSAAIAAAHPWVEVVAGDGSLFYAGGTNAGLRHLLAQPLDYVMLANDDAVFPRDLLQELLQASRGGERRVVGGLLLRWDTPHVAFQVGQVWDTWYGGWRIPSALTAFTVPQTPWPVATLAGNCVWLPARALTEVGPLDERRFPHHWADAEFCARLRRAGWQLVVAPRARVFCQPNTNPTSLGRLSFSAQAVALFRNRFHPLYLPGQWRMRWHTAPTRLHGVAASCVYTVRLGLRALGRGTWPAWPDPPLPASPATEALHGS